MNITDFKFKRKKEIANLIADMIKDSLYEAAKYETEEELDNILSFYQEFLDNADGYDFFGTEGWKHQVGLD